jgi:hypothetical protein
MPQSMKAASSRVLEQISGCHSGDALRCKVKFIYIFDDKGTIIEQRTEIFKVLKFLRAQDIGHR